MKDGRPDPHAADVLARPHQRERPPHHLVRRRQHAADPRSSTRNFFEPGDPRSNAVLAGRRRRREAVGRGRPGRRRRARTRRRIRRNTAIPARRRAGCWRRCPPGPTARAPLRYTNPATGGAVMPTLDCYAVRLPKGAADAAEARHLQHDLPGGVGRGPLDHRRAHLRLVAARRVHRSRTGPSRSHKAKDGDADLFIVSDKVGVRAARPAARGTAISAAPPTIARRRHRRVGARASRTRVSCAATAASSPTSRCPASCTACWCARRTPMPASAASTCAAAAALPGVVAVLTGADMAADNVGPMAPLWAIRSHDGKPMAEPPRCALARDTRAPCRRAGRRGDRRDARAGGRTPPSASSRLRAAAGRHRRPRGACGKDAPQLHDGAPGNVCFRCARGDEAAVRKAFDGAAHVVSARSRQQPADRRGDRAARGAGRRRAPAKLTLYCATQVPHHIRRSVTEQLGMPQSAIRAGRARCRRRLRLQGQALSGGDRSSPGRRGGCGGR